MSGQGARREGRPWSAHDAIIVAAMMGAGVLGRAGPCGAQAVTMADVISRADPIVSELTVSPRGVMGVVKAVGRTPTLTLWTAAGEQPLAPGSLGAISPDGRWLLALQGSDWVLKDLAGGAERRLKILGHVSAPTGAPVWSPDSRYVAAHYDVPSNLHAIEVADRRDGVPVETFDASTPRSRSPGWAYRNPSFLIWNVSEAQPRTTAVQETESYAGSWWINKAGRHVYSYAAAQIGYGGRSPFTAVRTLTAEDGSRHELYRTANFNQNAHPHISPHGGALAVALDLDTPRYGVANSVVLIDIASGRARRLTRAGAFGDAQWGSDGALYAPQRDGGLQTLDRIDLQGRVSILARGTWNRRGLAADPTAERMVYVGEDGYGRKAVLSWSPKGGETTIASLSDPTSRYALGRFERVAWRTPDGVRLKGFLVTPRDFSPRRRYPLLVDVHGGGPDTPLLLFSLFGYLSQTPLEWHAWAALGYVVFVPDYRSSGEYGALINRRRQAVRVGDDTGIVQDADDVASGVRWLMKKGFIDPKRLAIFGQSAGGGRVNYLLTRTHLFAAGVIHDPIGSGSVAEVLRAATLGLPAKWNLARLSPSDRALALGGFLFDGWRSTTPTLIMTGNPAHGALDPLSADTLFSILAGAHVPTELLRFPEDGHEPSSPAGALARFDAMKLWLDRFAPARQPASVQSARSRPHA